MDETINFWIIKGDGRRHWVAMLSQDGQRYSGDGETPWIAVAWALDERAHRRLGIVRMCHVAGAKPTLTPDLALVAAVAKEHAIHAEEERKRLPLLEAPCTKSKSAVARRARSKKSAKPGTSH